MTSRFDADNREFINFAFVYGKRQTADKGEILIEKDQLQKKLFSRLTIT